jgi:hypothetical protein
VDFLLLIKSMLTVGAFFKRKAAWLWALILNLKITHKQQNFGENAYSTSIPIIP